MSFVVSSFWLLALFAIVAVALAIWTYRRASVSAALRAWLVGLRALSLFFAFSLFLEPTLQTISRQTQKPKLAVVIDDSESLTISDDGVRRDSLLRELIERHLSDLSRVADVRWFAFGEALREANPSDLSFKEKRTNLSNALASLNRLNAKEKFNAALLMSDGEFNAGENPIYEAARSPIPIFATLLGDSSARKDIVLRRIFAPEQAIANSKVSVSVIVAQQGFSGRGAEVLLKSGETILSRKQVTLSAPEQAVAFEFVPKEIGEAKYVVSVSALQGEFSARNNSQAFFLRVLKNKKKVLVIAGLADPEISAARQTLNRAENIEAVFFSQKTSSEFFEGALNLSEHQDADVCLLIGFPSASASDELVERVCQFLNARKIPTFALIGAQSSGAKLKRCESLLAVSIGRTSPAEILDNNAFISQTAQAQSFVAFKPMLSSLQDALQAAPPLSHLDFNFQPKPSTQTLWKASVAGKATEKIAFAISQSAERKAATMCASQFWRFALSPDENVRRLYAQTLIGTIEWLSAKDDAKRFQVSTSRKLYDEGETVFFAANLQDELLSPVSTAQITMRVKNKQTGETYQTAFEPASEAGVYHARFDGFAKGDYVYSAEAKDGERIVGTASGMFSVSETSAEFRNPAANPETMRAIAERSGGKFYDARTFANFLDEMKREPAFQPLAVEKISAMEFANSWATWLAILLLLSAEWLLRKLNALP
ncbi:MAG: hypothetical protein NZM06_00965 [Chloroherpetonaceae bacterium]|nr:hypothetical protein [Chloroherpetonaceae bacterium]MDW8438409.1 hypothetical protein [Chloroherpetonaceae bacterium]